MAVVVIDASVIIAFLDPRDAHHGAAVAALADKRTADLVLPAIVYAEILVGPYRHGKSAVSKASETSSRAASSAERKPPRSAPRAADKRAASSRK